VGVWRELRRIKHIDASAPTCLHIAHEAANNHAANDEQEARGASWDKYCEAQGGVFCGRGSAIKLMLEQPEALGRYGEQQAPRPVGVQVAAPGAPSSPYGNGISYRNEGIEDGDTGPCIGNGYGYGYGHQSTPSVWEVRSARYKWEFIRGVDRAAALGFETERAQPSTPWTCVDNCTELGSWPTAHENKASYGLSQPEDVLAPP
jgi:hypothetical protein